MSKSYPDTNGKRSLNHIDRDDQRALAISFEKNAFHLVQCAATNPDALTSFHERMRSPRHVLVDQFSHKLDLRLGNPRPFWRRTNEPDYARCPQNLHPAFVPCNNLHKHVPGKQRHFNFLPTIAPAPNFTDSRQVVADAPHVEMVRHHLFMA